MKKYVFIVITILLHYFASAQECYYYYKGEKIFLSLDTKKLNLTTTTNFQKDNLDIPEIENLSLGTSLRKNAQFGIISIRPPQSVSRYSEIIEQLKNEKEVIAVHPNYITQSNKEIGMSSYFYVRLKQESDIEFLKDEAEKRDVVIVEQNEFLPLWFTLICTEKTVGNTLDVANSFYETGLFASAIPDFLSDDALCTNDPYFSQLWGLNNVLIQMWM